jgi:hypothetical protein
MRGQTQGLVANETVALGYGGAVAPPTDTFELDNGKAYIVSVELVVRAVIGGTPTTRSMTLKASARCDSGTATIAGTNTGESFGDAGFATATLTITASTNTLVITFGTGSGVTAEANVVARVQFTEVTN